MAERNAGLRLIFWPIRALWRVIRGSTLLLVLLFGLVAAGTGYLSATSEEAARLGAGLAARLSDAPTLREAETAERAALEAALAEAEAAAEAALEQAKAADEAATASRREADTALARIRELETAIFFLEGEVLVLKDDLADAAAAAEPQE